MGGFWVWVWAGWKWWGSMWGGPGPLGRLPFLGARAPEIDPEHFDRALALGDEADDGPHQHRFALARAPDEAENLAAKYVERKLIEDAGAAEAHDEIAHPDGNAVGGGRHFAISRSRRRTSRTGRPTRCRERCIWP